jgi:hypothetical protein
MTDDQRSSRPTRGRVRAGGRQREDGGRTAQARHAAEALFQPKSGAEPAAAVSPTEDGPARRRRVLAALPPAPRPPAAVEAPTAPQSGSPQEIPASEFARIRAWVTYGMTVRDVAGIYGVPIEAVRSILQRS